MILQDKLKGLSGRSFEINKQRFDVTDVRYHTGKYYVYTRQQTFVKDNSQFETFLDTIRMLAIDEPVKLAFVPDKEKITLKKDIIMDTETTTAVTTAASNTEKVSNALLDMFNKLSGDPTEDDYKKAEAMSKMAHTMVSVSQTQINLLKLKQSR